MSLEYFPKFTEALKNSEAGTSLLNTYRWESHFRTNETKETWRDVFGATGQVFTHSILFYNLAEWFLRKEEGRFTPEKEELFLYGVGPHDTGVNCVCTRLSKINWGNAKMRNTFS